MCEFVICWRVNDGRGNVSVVRSWFRDEDISKVEGLGDVSRFLWDTGACWLEEFQEGMEVIEPDEGIALADM